MNRYYRLLSNYRLFESLAVLLIIAMLYGLCLPIYKAYVVNAYALDQAYVMVDVKTQLSIDSAFTGEPNGAGDYSRLADKNRGVASIEVSSQGHITTKATMTGLYSGTPSFVQTALNDKTLVLHKNINSQSGYDVLSWQCVSRQNKAPFRVIDPVADGTLEPKYYSQFCKG